MGSQFTGASATAGKSKMSGRSYLTAQGEDILASMLKYHAYVINSAILEMNLRLQQVGRQEILSLAEFSRMQEEIGKAEKLAKQNMSSEALGQLRDAYREFCYNPDVAEEDKEKVGSILTDLNPKWLEQENDIKSRELVNLCNKLIKVCEKEDLDKEAWESFKESVLEARKIASNKQLLQIAMVRCNSTDAALAETRLREAGLEPRIFDSTDSHNTSYIVVPKCNNDVKALIQAAIVEARIQHEEANVISEASMDMLMRLRREDDRQIISGLTLTEAEAVWESLYGKKLPFVVKEPETTDGTFSLIYSKRNAKMVSSLVFQEMVRERGAGYDANIGQILQTNYMARQGVDILISKISLGSDTFGYVVDADHPEHHLLITNKGITETFQDGQQEFVRFDKASNPAEFEVEIKERVMQLAPRIAFMPAKAAKACGIDRDHFEITDALTKKLEEIKNPQSKMLVDTKETPEETQKYQEAVKTALAGQTSFARYAAQKAVDMLPEDQVDLKAVTQYVSQNVQELLGQYKHDQEQRIQRTAAPEDREKELKVLDQAMKMLRGKTKLNVSIEDTLKDISDNILPDKAKVTVRGYHTSSLDPASLDEINVNEKDVAEFRRQADKEHEIINEYEYKQGEQKEKGEKQKEDSKKTVNNKLQKDPPLTKTQAEEEVRKNIEDIERKKNVGMRTNKLPEKKAEAIAVACVLCNNLDKAIIKKENIPPADPYLQAYHIIPEETVIKIDERFQEVCKLSLEAYDRLSEQERDKYSDDVHKIIKNEVQREVAEGMKFRAEERNNLSSVIEERNNDVDERSTTHDQSYELVL